MVAGTDGDGLAVEQRRHIVRMRIGEVEGDDPGAVVRRQRAVDADAGHLARQHVQRVLDEVALVRSDVLHPEVGEVVERGAQPDGRT